VARDIRIRITGSSGDLERAAAEAGIALEILGKDADRSGKKLKGFSSGIPFIGGSLDGLNKDLLKTAGGFLSAIPGMEGFGQELVQMAPMLAPILSWAEAIPVAMFGVLFAVNALTLGLGMLLAVIGDLVAPVALVTGLLGGLGIAFVLAGKKAFGGGGALSGQLSVLKHQFDNLTTTLANDFMPVFRFLIDNAHQALRYLNQIAHLPLAEAFKSLATTGVQAVTRFLNQVGHMLARPIKLALRIAFGSGKGGNEVSSAVSGLWNQFVRFWTGYTKTQRLNFNGHVVVTQTQVDGALQPFLDWFNRHNFTAQGEKIANTIMGGVAKIAGPLSTLLGHIFLQAGQKAFSQLWSLGNRPLINIVPTKAVLNDIKQVAIDAWHYDAAHLKEILGGAFLVVAKLGRNAWNDVKQDASGVWHAIATIARVEAGSIATAVRTLLSKAWNATKSAAGDAFHYARNLAGGILASIQGWIQGKVAGAWNAVKNAAQRVWNFISGLFSKVLSVHISWPSPPGWVTSLLGGAGGLLGKIPHSIPSFAQSVPSVAQAISQAGSASGLTVVNFTQHVHGTVVDTAGLARATRRGLTQLGRVGTIRGDVLERTPLVSQ